MKKVFVILTLVYVNSSTLASESATWIAPIGIPTPEFGIEESHLMYSGEAGYKDAGHGPYTIYVDNSASNCRDSGPGTAAKPRCEIPDDISEPGTVVEIHGGPYDYELTKPLHEANGSAERPVFIRGVDDGNGFPVIENASVFALQGQYVILEDLNFQKSSVRSGAAGTPKYGRHHISIRNLEIARHPSKNGSGLAGTDIVFYKNHVHHHQGDDRHGTSVAAGSSRVWIVDNYIHHNGGDAIQFCHGCKKNIPRKIFIGRNLMHSDRENAVDLKFGKDIVISENTMYGYRRAKKGEEWCYDDDSYCGVFTSGSDGAAVVIGSDGAPGRPWVIANNIFDSMQGIRVEEVREAWIIGNNIHNISQNAIALQKWGEALHVTGNTMHGAKYGINQYWRDKFSIFASNNVFSLMSEESLHAKSSVAQRSVIENNVFWNGDKKVQFRWGRNYSKNPSGSLTEFQVGDAMNFVVDPEIIRVSDDRIELTPGNPAFETYRANLQQHEEKFKSIYGESASIMQLADRNQSLANSPNK